MREYTMKMMFANGLKITQRKRRWSNLYQYLEKFSRIGPFSSDIPPKLSRMYLFKRSMFYTIFLLTLKLSWKILVLVLQQINTEKLLFLFI